MSRRRSAAGGCDNLKSSRHVHRCHPDLKSDPRPNGDGKRFQIFTILNFHADRRRDPAPIHTSGKVVGEVDGDEHFAGVGECAKGRLVAIAGTRTGACVFGRAAEEFAGEKGTDIDDLKFAASVASTRSRRPGPVYEMPNISSVASLSSLISN